MNNKKNKINIAITTGDVDGVGLEVTLKALLQISRSKNTNFDVFLSSKNLALHKIYLNKMANSSIRHSVQFVLREDSPAKWVEDDASRR